MFAALMPSHAHAHKHDGSAGVHRANDTRGGSGDGADAV